MALPRKNLSAALVVLVLLAATEAGMMVAGDDALFLVCTPTGFLCKSRGAPASKVVADCKAYCKGNGHLLGSCADQATDGFWPCKCCDV